MPSNDDLLFADHAMRAGFLTQEAVDESLAVQARMAEMGVRESLAAVLVKRGVLKDGDAAIISRRAGITSGREPIPGYELVKRIGSGAMGSVYLAFQKGMQRNVAIKILRRDLTDDPRQVERLRREAQLVGQLDHPHIVRGLDSGESNGLVWFVMEYVDGETLRKVIKQRERLPLDDALDVMLKLASALEHAHAHGVVHRDIKPGNVLLSRDGEPRLSDYGLAKGETDDALTHVDATLGTPQYIAPEQARNPRDADIRSDIYSLGATFYTMLTGHPPFEGDTLAQILTKVLYQRPKPLEEVVPGIPAAAVYLVEKMMARKREHRYATPTELLTDLRALARGKLQVPLGFRGDMDAFVKTRRKRNAWVAVVGILAALTVAGFAYVDYQDGKVEEAALRERDERFGRIVGRIGPAEQWTGEFVEEMVGRLGTFLETYPDHGPAQQELDRWRAQAAALDRVNALNIEVHRDESSYVAVLLRFRKLVDDLRVRENADVARRRAAEQLAHWERRRDEAADEEQRKALAQLADLRLRVAADHLESLADDQVLRFYGDPAATPVAACRELAAKFRKAQARIEEHFSPFDTAKQTTDDLEKGRYLRLSSLLSDCYREASNDLELRALLLDLPPRGTREDAADARYEAELSDLQAASAQAWIRIQQEARKLVDDRRPVEALTLLNESRGNLLEAQRLSSEAMFEQIEQETEAGQKGLSARTEQTQRELFDALRSRSYGAARQSLASLEKFARGFPEDGNQGLTLVRSGERLIGLVESRIWEPAHAHFAAGRPLDHGIAFGSIRWSAGQIERYELVENRFRLFQTGHDEPFVYSLREIDVDDLVRYAAPDPNRPGDALAEAAIRLTEYTQPLDPLRVDDDLRAIEDLLITARRDAELRFMADRLTLERMAKLETAKTAVGELEAEAEQLHATARSALERGDVEEANQALEDLNDRKFGRTRYMHANRRIVERLADEIEAMRQTLDYASLFPGARVSRVGRNRGRLEIDFEDNRVAGWLGLVPGVTGLVTRHLIAADAAGAPADGDSTPPVRREQKLAWAAWSGDPKTHPRLHPVRFVCPFDYRRPIEVTFLYRSDAPYAFLLAIRGAAFGVLSADDDTEGGRGVRIFHADDWSRPDLAFTDRNRPGYVESHPEAERNRGDTEFFQFRPDRVYRVRFVKEERRARLFVDGRLVAAGDIRPSPAGQLSKTIEIVSYTSGEIDDLVVTGTLDPRSRPKEGPK